jgi:hypothetical protein
LVHRFPVALRFTDDFTPRRQVRLSGYGRRLSRRVGTRSSDCPDPGEFHARLSAYIGPYAEQYRRHLEALRVRGKPEATVPIDVVI